MRNLIGEWRGVRDKAPVSFASGGTIGNFASLSNRADTKGLMDQYGASGTLYAVVSRITDDVTSPEWAAYRKDPTRDTESVPDAKRERIPRHAALVLWENPNPFMDQSEFIEASQQHYELTGEIWWLVVKDARTGWPIEMWPIRPDRIEVIPSATEFIAGYVYRAPDGEKVPLSRDDVISIKHKHPTDPYRGLGPVQSILPDLEGANLASEWSRNFFLNSARPGGVIEVDHRMGEDEYREFRTRWNEGHAGVAQAHKVAILEQATWKDSALTMIDMQFTELRRLSSDMILEAFGFPKAMIGVSIDVNRANADAALAMYARSITRPRLRRLRSALNKRLLPMFGKLGADIEFDYKDPVLEDSDQENKNLVSKATALDLIMAAGFAPGDATAAVGLPDMGYIGRAAKVGGASLIIEEDGTVRVVPVPGIVPTSNDTP